MSQPSRRGGGPVAAQVRPVVASLVATVVSAGGKEPDPELVERAADALLDRIADMPRYLGAPMLAATVAFEAYGLANGAARFSRATPERRRRQLAAWRRAPLAVFRDFVAFYEKMGNFAYFSLVEERDGHVPEALR